MKQTINKSQFRNAFNNAGRKEQFSYDGLGALYDYLDDMDSDFELDVIALCCEFSEATLDKVKQSYPDIESFDDLAKETMVIPVDDETVIYQQY